MIGYIYITTNLINGKKYIGQHHAPEFTTEYKGSGKLLLRAINKYGWSNFTVELLESCDTTDDDLDELEKKWIKYYDATNSEEFYNLHSGGKFGNHTGSRASYDTRKKMSKIRKTRVGENAPMYGKHHSEDSKMKISNGNKYRVGSNNPFYGKKHSPETIRKMSESPRNLSSITRKRLSDSKKNRKWITKDNTDKFVHESELPAYLELGWVLGRYKRK